MRRGEKQIDAFELHAVHFGRRREVEHRIKIDAGFGIRTFADESGPHRIVQCGIFAAHWLLYFEDDAVFLGFDLIRVDAGHFFYVVDRLEVAVLGAILHDGRGLRAAQRQSAFKSSIALPLCSR